MRVCVPKGDAGGAKGGSERGGDWLCTSLVRERECVCVCVCGCGCGCARERERESVCVCVCVWIWMQVCAIRYETIWGVALRELGTDKQKGWQ